MSLTKRLEQVLESAEYASSEVYSARENLPDYRTNESSRDYLSQSESYLETAMDGLRDLLEELKAEERGMY